MYNIGKIYRVDPTKIRDWLNFYGIAINPTCMRLAKNSVKRELLESLYIVERKSTTEIATILGITPRGVSYHLTKQGIPIRSKSEAAFKGNKARLSKSQLEDFYLHQGLPMEEIAKRTGLSYPTINRQIHEYGIPLRRELEGGKLQVLLSAYIKEGRTGGSQDD